MTFRLCVKFKCLLYTFSCPRFQLVVEPPNLEKTHQKCQRGSFHVISPLSLGKNIIPKRLFQTTLDGSEIPNNHRLDVLNPVKNWDILPYQLVSRISEPSTVPSKTQVFHPHLQPSNSPPVSSFQVSKAHCSIANAWLQFPWPGRNSTPRKINGWNLKIT